MKTPFFLFLAGAVASTAFGAEYTIDSAHSAAGFAVRHMMVSKVRGAFSKVTGKVIYDPNNVAASSIEATIDMNTVNTQEPKRDAHLKSPDFFDAAQFPTMTFKSKKVSKTSSGQLHVLGDLTLRGVTKEVALAVTVSDPVKMPNGQRLGATATTTINRQDFGVKWSRNMDGGGVVVSDDVDVTLDIAVTGK